MVAIRARYKVSLRPRSRISSTERRSHVCRFARQLRQSRSRALRLSSLSHPGMQHFIFGVPCVF